MQLGSTLFRKMSVVGSPLEFMTALVTSSRLLLQYQAWIFSQ